MPKKKESGIGVGPPSTKPTYSIDEGNSERGAKIGSVPGKSPQIQQVKVANSIKKGGALELKPEKMPSSFIPDETSQAAKETPIQ